MPEMLGPFNEAVADPYLDQAWYEMLGSSQAQELLSLMSDASLGIVSMTIPGIGCWKTNSATQRTTTSSANGDAVASMLDLAAPTHYWIATGAAPTYTANDANAPVLRTGTAGINGMPGLEFASGKGLAIDTNHFISTSLQTAGAFSIYTVAKSVAGATSAVGGYVGQGDGSADGQWYVGRRQSSGTFRAQFNSLASAAVRDAVLYDASNGVYGEDCGVTSWHYTAAATGNMSANTIEIQRSNAVVMTDSAAGTLDLTPTGNHTRLMLGNLYATSAFVCPDILGAVIICSVCHTAAQRLKITRALEAYYRIVNPLIIAVGDSNMAGYGYGLEAAKITGNYGPKAVLEAQLPLPTSPVYPFSPTLNFQWCSAGELASTYGTQGAVTSGVTATNKFQRRVAHYAGAGARRQSICWIALGQNDICVGGLTGAQAWDQILGIIQLATAVFGVVVVQTLHTRGTAQNKVDIGTCNTLIRDNAATYGYLVSDTAARTELSDNTSDVYFQSDDVHLAPPGIMVVVDEFLTTLKDHYGIL